MTKKFILFLICLFAPFMSYAVDTYSVDGLLQRTPDNTQCATAIFADALKQTVDTLKNTGTPDEQAAQDADSSEIDTWVHLAFSMPSTLTKILECPELQNAADNDTIVFEPVSYTFPNGRIIDINYETQKSILLDKLRLATKPKLPIDDINPDIAADAANGTVWVNVDPAWYAILVSEHGTLDNYVAPGKTNVLALRYLEDNITDLYPKNHGAAFQANCTSKSAWAGDNDMINRAVTTTVGGSLPRDAEKTDAEREQEKQAKSNDYYVFGDVNLQWVAALEIAADVVLTIVTWGGYGIVNGVLKLTRATRGFAQAQKALRVLRKSNDVMRWVKTSRRSEQVAQAIKFAENGEDAYSTISSINKTAQQTVKTLTHKRDLLRARNADPKTIRAVEQELEIATKQAKSAAQAAGTAEKLRTAEQTINKVSDIEKTIANTEKEIKQIENNMKTLNKQSQLYRNQQSQLAKMKNNLNSAKSQLKTAEKNAEAAKQEITNLKQTYKTELNELQKNHSAELSALEKTKDVQKYQELAQAERELAHTAYLLRQGKVAWRANRGLLPVRAYRAAKATRAGLKSAKNMNKTLKVVRANTSGVSAKINDWLFHNTMKNITAISKVPAALSGLNMAVKIAGDMYDVTDTETGNYTNNIDMKPLLLLGADDLPGYENEVNYGMWLFWAGSSTSAADDDAAFLQAMSFAEKLHQDLTELQDDKGIMACDVDIWVVRPIIRNPGTPNQELYYLFMNDTPWTTHGYNEPNDEQNTNVQNDVPTDTDMHTRTLTTQSGNGYYEPPYDGTKTGQSCTPPSSTAGNFSNAILTTGRYADISPAFEKAMITKFRTEGACGSHPDDPGGYTCYGVSSKFFPQAKNKNFSRADAEDIAYNSFWKKHNIGKLPDAISGDVFMALWGTGSKQNSIGLLQEILGVKKTGIVDDATVTAAQNYTGNLRTQFLDKREEQFRRGKKAFRTGWLNALQVYRANGCHTVAK